MKQSIILLFILSTHLIMAQTPTQPKPLFAQQNMNVLLYENDKGDNVYLTSVRLWEKEKFSSPELDTLKLEKAFAIDYGVRERTIGESQMDVLEIGATVVFFKSAGGTYQIMGSSYLTGWWVSPIPLKVQEGGLEDPFMRSMSFEAPLPSPYTLVGNSTDTTLFAVKVWNYVKEHTDDGEIRKLIE